MASECIQEGPQPAALRQRPSRPQVAQRRQGVPREVPDQPRHGRRQALRIRRKVHPQERHPEAPVLLHGPRRLPAGQLPGAAEGAGRLRQRAGEGRKRAVPGREEPSETDEPEKVGQKGAVAIIGVKNKQIHIFYEF